MCPEPFCLSVAVLASIACWKAWRAKKKPCPSLHPTDLTILGIPRGQQTPCKETSKVTSESLCRLAATEETEKTLSWEPRTLGSGRSLYMSGRLILRSTAGFRTWNRLRFLVVGDGITPLVGTKTPSKTLKYPEAAGPLPSTSGSQYDCCATCGMFSCDCDRDSPCHEYPSIVRDAMAAYARKFRVERTKSENSQNTAAPGSAFDDNRKTLNMKSAQKSTAPVEPDSNNMPIPCDGGLVYPLCVPFGCKKHPWVL